MFKSKVFAKYFASYIVLLITVFTVLVAVFAYAFSFTRSTVEDSVLNQFEQIGQYFEGKISELKNTADLMCNNEYLTHYKLSNAGPMAINGIKELRKIRVSNSFINDLFICYKDNFIYCQRGKASMDVYLDKMLHLDETSVSRTEEAVLHSTGSEMHPLNMVSGTYDNQPEYLLCTYPISSNNRSIGTIGFIVSQDTLKKALTSMLGEHGVGVRMLLPTGEVISEVNQSGVEHLFDGGYDGEYMYYSHTIDAPAFSFSVAIDSRSVFSYVKRLKTWSYSAVIVVFASSILLSYVFSRKHYKPIKMLENRRLRKTEVLTVTPTTSLMPY